MFRTTVFISLMLVASVLCVMSLSCESCGSECSPVCGTRRFRSCCFNYLRKKRQDHDYKEDNAHHLNLPVLVFNDFPNNFNAFRLNTYKLQSQD